MQKMNKKYMNNHVAITWPQCSTLLDDVESVWEGLNTAGFEGNEGRQMGRKSSSFLKCCSWWGEKKGLNLLRYNYWTHLLCRTGHVVLMPKWLAPLWSHYQTGLQVCTMHRQHEPSLQIKKYNTSYQRHQWHWTWYCKSVNSCFTCS